MTVLTGFYINTRLILEEHEVPIKPPPLFFFEFKTFNHKV